MLQRIGNFFGYCLLYGVIGLISLAAFVADPFLGVFVFCLLIYILEA